MSYSDYLLSTSPVAYWELSADGSDASGNGHAATPSSLCQFGKPGMIPGEADSSLYLSGSASVAIPNLNLLPPFSISGIIDPQGDAGTSTGLASLVGYSSSKRILWRDTSMNQPNNCLVVEMGAANLLTPAGSVPAGKATHWAYVTDGVNEFMYLNGALAASQANTHATWNAAAWIGAYGVLGGAYQLVGNMEKVAVHNVALSAAQVAQLATLALDPSPGAGMYAMLWNGTEWVQAVDGVTTARPNTGVVFWEALGSGQVPTAAQTYDILVP